MKKRKETLEIKRKLTEQEYNDRLKEYSEKMLEILRLKEELADYKKTAKSEIQFRESETDCLLCVIDKKEDKFVEECESEFDFETGTVTVRSLVTDEVVFTRPMTDADRQQPLFDAV